MNLIAFDRIRFIAGIALAPLIVIGVSRAQIATFATGIFQTNGPATISAKPMAYISGAIKDTTFVFQTDAKNQAVFSLPVSAGSSPVAPVNMQARQAETIRILRTGCGQVKLFFPPAQRAAQITLYALTGRFIAALRMQPDGSVTIAPAQHANTTRIVQAQNGSQRFVALVNSFAASARIAPEKAHTPIATSAALQAAAAPAQYAIALSSKSAALRDTGNILVPLNVNDNGTIALAMPAAAMAPSERFKELVTQTQYNALFPNRYGLGKAAAASDGKFDFYTYASLLTAIDEIADVMIKVVQRTGINYCQKVVWRRKSTGETRIMINSTDYNASWNIGLREDTVAIVDYANFCAEGDLTTRKRELAAFCANIAHETTGGWPSAPNGGEFAWGLYWREETAWQLDPNNTTLGYVAPGDVLYPPYPGKSYHGRGPIQISWNYKYGQVSEFLYGDKNVLLQAPEKVIASGDVAFMTAIWFWMYPQYPKPSCHNIMCGSWVPNAADIAAGRDKSRFGNTINVINGNLECGLGNNIAVTNRVGHYKYFANIFQITVESVCDCNSMKPY
jgi:hypothetical protein